MFFEGSNNLGDRGGFLSAGNIDTVYRFAFFIKFPLIDDGIDCNGTFSRLSVSDDQFPLTPSDGDH